MNLRSGALLLLGLLPCLGLSTRAESETSVVAPAPARGFITTLSDGDRAAAGIDKLTAEQQTELNSYVSREAALARAGNIRGFAGTFVGRRNPAEQVAAGLNRLTDAEQAKLNELVAGVLASGVSVTVGTSRLTKEVVSRQKDPLQVHGEVSFTYGWQKGGGDFKGGSIFVSAYDPDSRISVGIGYAQYEGNGWYGYGPGYYGYGPGYYYSPALARFGGGPDGPMGCVRHP